VVILWQPAWFHVAFAVATLAPGRVNPRREPAGKSPGCFFDRPIHTLMRMYVAACV